MGRVPVDVVDGWPGDQGDLSSIERILGALETLDAPREAKERPQTLQLGGIFVVAIGMVLVMGTALMLHGFVSAVVQEVTGAI